MVRVSDKLREFVFRLGDVCSDQLREFQETLLLQEYCSMHLLAYLVLTQLLFNKHLNL
jgi:hypothetical protein